MCNPKFASALTIFPLSYGNYCMLYSKENTDIPKPYSKAQLLTLWSELQEWKALASASSRVSPMCFHCHLPGITGNAVSGRSSPYSPSREKPRPRHPRRACKFAGHQLPRRCSGSTQWCILSGPGDVYQNQVVVMTFQPQKQSYT